MLFTGLCSAFFIIISICIYIKNNEKFIAAILNFLRCERIRSKMDWLGWCKCSR